ncbi:outer membrane beta-barrel protein [Algoriphagus sp. SE2]|uniref:outer membrane beta-barrel protein n=1 Tax=Algoriphagus sp. SE2 TaxID=3141536 RepID=UPI0031CD2550
MKKTILLFLTCFIFGSIATAQTQGDSRIHALGSYGLRYKYFGVGAGVEYFFVDNFAIMPSYTRIFPNVGKSSNFSADLRYYVSVGSSQLYFMAGYSQNWENTNPDGAGTSRNVKGANVGVGAYIPMTDWIGLSTEFKVQSQNPQEAGFRFGFAFPL